LILFAAFLTTLMLASDDDVWIGFNDVNWEMKFLWTDGNGVSYTNWAKGQPSSLPDGSSRMYGAARTWSCEGTLYLVEGLWLKTITAMRCLIYDGNRTISYEPDGKVLSSSQDRTVDWWCWGRWIISVGSMSPSQFSQETKNGTFPLQSPIHSSIEMLFSVIYMEAYFRQNKTIL